MENVQCILTPKVRRQKRPKCSTLKDFTQLCTQQRQASFQQLTNDDSQSHSTPASRGDLNTLGSCDALSSLEDDDGIDWRAAAFETVPLPISSDPSTSGSCDRTFLESDTSRSPATPEIPSFIEPIPSYLTREDVDYLHRKGALRVPEIELRDALLESYVHYIHPCYPILELGVLKDSIQGTSDNRVSLLLFQAIMFAGAAWVDVKLLRRLGFLTRKAARKAFYLKVKLLYDLDFEQDRLSLVQTLVLLSLWWEGPNEQKDGWYWSGLSLSVARTIGLNRDVNSKHLSPELRALRRRLWWCCAMRDTIASFGTSRPPRLRDSDFEVAPLTLEDFEYDEFRLSDLSDMGGHNSKNQRQLAGICIETAGICRIIGRVLQAAYNETELGNIDSLYFNSVSKKGRSTIEPQKLRDIQEDIRRWLENVPTEALHVGPIPASSSKHEQALLVHRAMLSMLYHTGLIMLHRQRSCVHEASLLPEREPRTIVREAAAQVNKIVMDLYKADLMKDLPATGISCLFPVSISHVLDIRSNDPVLSRGGRRRLEECKQALRELADAHIAAEWAVNFLTYVQSSASAPPRTHHTRIPNAVNTPRRSVVPGQSQIAEPTLSSQVSNQSQLQLQESHHKSQAIDEANEVGVLATEQLANTVDQSIELDALSPTTYDSLSDMINFPEMWMSFPETQDTAVDPGWLPDGI
ncbi:hypothetical protein LTR98_007835 [Exophiala xenobiotica]|nr:hypothetical protein LTR98_007835 [Exophiala xenobiotica]